MAIEIKVYKGFCEEVVDLICSLESEIFTEPYSREKITRESSVKPNLISIFAFQNGKAIGFKVGYEMSSRLFYSWIGGVLKEHRKKGIARRLMLKQHDLAHELGYKTVRTHTENQYKEMLLLNINNGFDIVGVINDTSKPRLTIVLDKKLDLT